MTPEPSKEHQWLQKLVGEWTYETEAHEPGKDEVMRMSGTQSIRPIGGLWIQGDMRETTDEGPQLSVLTIGFDPERDRFVGSFVSSMMPGQWIYDGKLDGAGNALTLDTEGPDMSGEGGRAPYRDIVEVQDADHFVFRSEMQTPGGEWVGFMRMSLSRTG